MMVVMMTMMTGSERRSGSGKHHQQQHGSDDLLHSEHPSTRLISGRRRLTPLVPNMQQKWDDAQANRKWGTLTSETRAA